MRPEPAEKAPRACLRKDVRSALGAAGGRAHDVCVFPDYPSATGCRMSRLSFPCAWWMPKPRLQVAPQQPHHVHVMLERCPAQPQIATPHRLLEIPKMKRRLLGLGPRGPMASHGHFQALPRPPGKQARDAKKKHRAGRDEQASIVQALGHWRRRARTQNADKVATAASLCRRPRAGGASEGADPWPSNPATALRLSAIAARQAEIELARTWPHSKWAESSRVADCKNSNSLSSDGCGAKSRWQKVPTNLPASFTTGRPT